MVGDTVWWLQWSPSIQLELRLGNGDSPLESSALVLAWWTMALNQNTGFLFSLHFCTYSSRPFSFRTKSFKKKLFFLLSEKVLRTFQLGQIDDR